MSNELQLFGINCSTRSYIVSVFEASSLHIPHRKKWKPNQSRQEMIKPVRSDPSSPVRFQIIQAILFWFVSAVHRFGNGDRRLLRCSGGTNQLPPLWRTNGLQFGYCWRLSVWFHRWISGDLRSRRCLLGRLRCTDCKCLWWRASADLPMMNEFCFFLCSYGYFLKGCALL